MADLGIPAGASTTYLVNVIATQAREIEELRQALIRASSARGSVNRSYVPALKEQLAYALDALEGSPWTGWTTDDARAVLREQPASREEDPDAD
jgi:hypothetical protein